jgi:hypothetical protein
MHNPISSQGLGELHNPIKSYRGEQIVEQIWAGRSSTWDWDTWVDGLKNKEENWNQERLSTKVETGATDVDARMQQGSKARCRWQKQASYVLYMEEWRRRQLCWIKAISAWLIGRFYEHLLRVALGSRWEYLQLGGHSSVSGQKYQGCFFRRKRQRYGRKQANYVSVIPRNN